MTFRVSPSLNDAMIISWTLWPVSVNGIGWGVMLTCTRDRVRVGGVVGAVGGADGVESPQAISPTTDNMASIRMSARTRDLHNQGESQPTIEPSQFTDPGRQGTGFPSRR